MSTNVIISLIIIAIIAVIFTYLFLNQFKNETVNAPIGSSGLISYPTMPATENQNLPISSVITPLMLPKTSPTNSPIKTATPAPSSVSTLTPVPSVKVITYTNSGFLPSPLTIKVGETVTFKNDSSRSFWPASAMHPIHAVYPVYGGCINSIFDSCKAYSPGESWSFTFTIKGNWGYHDHLNASYYGTVVVE